MMWHFRLLSYAIFSVHSLRFWLEMNDVQHADIVIRQAMYESGHGRCGKCALSEYNNIWGFQNNKGYLKFKHWTESVKFYSEWQKKYYSGGDYYEFLRKK